MRLAEALTTNSVALPYSADVVTAATATWVTITVVNTPSPDTSVAVAAQETSAPIVTTSETGLQREQVGGVVVGICGLILLIILLWYFCSNRRRRSSDDGPFWSPTYQPPPDLWSAPPPTTRPPPQDPHVLSWSHPSRPGISHPPEAAGFIVRDGPPMETRKTQSKPIRGDQVHLIQMEPRTALVTPRADKSYDKATTKSVMMKKGHTFLVGESEDMTPRPIGFARRKPLRRAKNVRLPPEDIHPLQNSQPGNSQPEEVVAVPDEVTAVPGYFTAVPAPEVVLIRTNTSVRYSRTSSVARATNPGNKDKLGAAPAGDNKR
jgi:hypothetical protein